MLDAFMTDLRNRKVEVVAYFGSFPTHWPSVLSAAYYYEKHKNEFDYEMSVQEYLSGKAYELFKDKYCTSANWLQLGDTAKQTFMLQYGRRVLIDYANQNNSYIFEYLWNLVRFNGTVFSHSVKFSDRSPS